MDHDTLYEKAVEAITALFSDQSVSSTQTRESLEELIGEIEVMLDALNSDAEKE